MTLPIEKKLLAPMQIDRARLQDIAVEALYSMVTSTVLHGGTAIWRCYSGNRFSDDLDIYLMSNAAIDKVRAGLAWPLRKYGAVIKKASVIGSYTIMDISTGNATLKLEMCKSKHKIRPVERNYERTDGTFLGILTLSPEDFIYEKIAAYENRRYARDMYDIYHLSNVVEPEGRLRKSVCKFLDNIERPVDERVLKAIVYSGTVPSFQGMVDYVKRRFC